MADKADPVAHTAGWLSEATDGASEAGTRAQASEPVKRPQGRPSEYTEEKAIQFCAHMANGMSLRKSCEQPGMPSIATVYRWLEEHDSFQKRYARAERDRAEYLAEEALEVCDDEPDVNRAKLKVDTRKWFASKLHASKYGDRQILQGDKDNPLFDPLGQVLGAVTGKTRGIPSDKG